MLGELVDEVYLIECMRGVNSVGEVQTLLWLNPKA